LCECEHLEDEDQIAQRYIVQRKEEIPPMMSRLSARSTIVFAIIDLPVPANPMSHYTGGVPLSVLSNQDMIFANIETGACEA
jgi:hypothetical protein